MPGYRRTSVFIDSSPGQRDLLASWAPPDLPTQPFPNPDRYLVDVGDNPADEGHFLTRNDALAEFRRPSRATATQLFAHWHGALGPDWQGIIFQKEPVTVGIGDDGQEAIAGILDHDLPDELREVTIFWVRSKRPPRRKHAVRAGQDLPWLAPVESGKMLSLGGVWKVPGGWPPGSPLDLVAATNERRFLDRDLDETYVKDYAKASARLPTATGALGPKNVSNYIEMLGFFNQLTPPTYIMSREGDAKQTVAFFRMMGRELDLSTWMTRPCLIVTGKLEGSPNPIPLRVNGERPEHDENSLTIVRWILPLDLNEPWRFPNPSPPAPSRRGATLTGQVNPTCR